jgi:hypothetical protein
MPSAEAVGLGHAKLLQHFLVLLGLYTMRHFYEFLCVEDSRMSRYVSFFCSVIGIKKCRIISVPYPLSICYTGHSQTFTGNRTFLCSLICGYSTDGSIL